MIAVRPPDYFPGIPFMSLATRVDTFVLADTFQYSRQSFHNRARLRNPQGWQWISVPLQTRPPDIAIEDALIENREPWQRKHWRAFEYNYRSTPYFEYYEPRFAPLFEQEWERLGDLTCATVELSCELLELDVRLMRASALEGAPDALPAVLDALPAVRADLLSLKDAAERNGELVEELRVLHVDEPAYRQNFEGFEPGMSFLDLLFNHGPKARGMLLDAGSIDGV